MAVSTDPSTLANKASCLESCIPEGMQWPILISIFAQIAGMSTDPNVLVAGAACINMCIPHGMQLPVLIYLATQIANGGGTGGGGASVAFGTSATPNTLGLGANILIYNQFDGSGNFVAQFLRNQNGVFV